MKIQKLVPYKIYFLGTIFCFCISFLLSGCSAKQTPSVLSDTRFMLNTVVTISLYDSSDSSILNGAFDLCQHYEDLLSRTKEGSEIYTFNHRKNNSPLTISDDTAELIQKALSYCELSNGTFDITIAPISSLWDFQATTPSLPDNTEIKKQLKNINYKDLQVKGNILSSKNPYTQIDLGAIAKGFIADKIKEYLIANNVQSAVINLGGNVLCVGEKPSKEPFHIGVQKPFETHQETVHTLSIKDLSIVSSGIYERYFKVDGKLYHHILNPKTGYPYDTDLTSVTILSKKSVDGDGLSTTCFSLGLEKGMELIESLDDVYALFITEDGTLHYTKGFQQFISES